MSFRNHFEIEIHVTIRSEINSFGDISGKIYAFVECMYFRKQFGTEIHLLIRSIIHNLGDILGKLYGEDI